MADLYAPQTQFLNTNGGQSEQQAPQGITGNADVDAYLSSLPESERNAALERLTAPPSADEIGEMVKGGYSPTFEEFDAVEAWHKNHEVNIIDGIGAGIEQVMGDLGRAVGAVYDHPMDVLSKSPANVVEAFSQGTRNFYGMLAQSADPTSKLFRFKNFLNGSGTKEERYNQYMEALAFNRHSAELMEGKTTLVMDKDMINPEVVQAASYIADPTLFIPFGQAASAGMRAVGLGEKMMLAGAKASAIKNAVIGGTLKWGVGAPVEFLGGAVRNTIDFGIDQGARAIEATTGIGAKEIAQTARLSGLPMSAASFAGHSIPYAGAVSQAYVGSSAARGLGEAISAIGDTMLKNKAFGRGINSWAREALENTPNLSGHAKGLLKVLDAVDPAFTYGAAITQGAAHGAMIGGTLGYLSGGEEGFAHGLGAGIALGAVGGGVGKGVADVTNQTLYGRVAIQRKMTIEGLKALGTTEATNKAMAFEALVKAAEGTNDRHYMAHIDGMIAGVDKVAPRSKWFVRSRAEHIDWLLKQEIDPRTGKLIEGAKLFPEFGSDRRARGRALGFLSLLGDQFAGVPDNLIKHLATLPQDHALRKAFFRLSGEQKAAVFEAIKNNANPEFRKALGETQGVERVSDANYEKWVKDNYEYFDPSNPENNVSELRRQLSEVGKSGLSTAEQSKKIDNLNARIKHIEEVKKQYNDWANAATPETRAKADAAQRKVWEGRGNRQMAEPITPKKATKPKLAEYYGDINYGEMQTARVNELFAKGDIDGARKLIGTFLKDNTNKDGSLNTRGRILRNKLAADGYFDKDGNLRPRRYTDNDAQPTAAMYGSAEGFVLKRDATGEIEVHISLDNITKDGVAHELFHAIFRESVLKPDFIDRLSKDLIGTFDKDGKLVKAGSVRRSEIREFFRRYIDLTNDKESDFKDEMARLESAIKEFETGSEAKTISPDSIAVLHAYAEEFGAYYFQNWLRAQSPDFLFRGGKLEGVRGIMDGVKNGWLDFWERTMQSKDPTFNFKALKEGDIDRGFKTENGKRVRVSSLDYFMRDFIRATADTNRGNFDINKLSSEGQAHYIQSNGLRNTHRVESTGRAVRLSRREAARANAVAGKEIYKILKGINPNRAVDGDGNFIGRLSEAELDAIVKSGHAPRAWANKLRQAYEILDGKQSNVVEFGYHGKTEQLTDASYPRLYGDDVSFKHRKAILLDVELKVGEKGTFHALFHTLDKAVIEARGDNIWKDSAVQSLWDGNRGSMEQDFFRYLENASKPDSDTSKKPSAELWTDGKGAQRRDALHQMLGMAKNEGDTFINRPTAEIPLGIRHSVTTFNNDGVSSFRVSGTERYKYNHDNAFRLLSRNWKPSEMKAEKTGLGEIVTHATGFKFIKDASGQVRAFTSTGSKLGSFESIEAAAKAGEAHYNKAVKESLLSTEKELQKQSSEATRFKPLSREARLEAIEKGDVFAIQEMIDFVGNRTLLRQTREEHILQRASEIADNPEQLLAHARNVTQRNKHIFDKVKQLKEEYRLREEEDRNFDKESDDQKYLALDELRRKYDVPVSYEQYSLNKKGKIVFEAGDEHFGGYEKTTFKEYEEHTVKANARMQASPEYAQWTKLKDSIDAQKDVVRKRRSQALDEVSKFEQANKEVLSNDTLSMTLESNAEVIKGRVELGKVKPEDAAKAEAEMFQAQVKGSIKDAEYSGVLESLFAEEYDNQIQTGKPFVAVTTHGTGHIELMLSRIFLDEKLGTHFNIASSNMGHFSGGSQGTSMAYAMRPPLGAAGSKLGAVFRKFMSIEDYRQADLYNPDGSFSRLGRYVEHIKSLKQQFDAAEIAIAKNYYDDYSKLYGYANELIKNNFINGEWKSDALAQEFFTMNQKLHDEGMLQPFNSRMNPDQNGMNRIVSKEEFIKSRQGKQFEEMMMSPEDVNGNPSKPTPYGVKQLASIRDQIFHAMRNTREFPEMFNLYPDKQMQLRKVVRMDNPYIVIDPRSYDEKKLSWHMQKAIDGGHDGIVFKRLADGGERDNVYALFRGKTDEGIKTLETSFDPDFVPRGKDETGRVLKSGAELNLAFKPMEANAPEGGRVYDQQGKQWKTGFIGRQSEENPELTKNVSLQHIDKANGVNKLVFTDNSTGESKNIGHITWDKFGGISTHIDPEFRGRGLSYLFYSEAAERMRAQGIKQSVSTIVNKEAIPVKVREAIFGDTRRFISRTEEGKPIGQAEAKAIIAAMQDQGGEYAGVTVSNKIDLNARYKPVEGDEGGMPLDNISWDEITSNLSDASLQAAKREEQDRNVPKRYTPQQMAGKFVGRIAKENPKLTNGLRVEFIKMRSSKFGDEYKVRILKKVKPIKGRDPSTYASEELVGYFTSEIDGNTAASGMAEIKPEFRNKGYGRLLYSEMAERLRELGARSWGGRMIDQARRPQTLRERVIDKENARLGYKDSETRLSDERQDYNGDKTFYIESKLHGESHYKPAESGEQGGRTYKDFQMGGRFIGKYAQENPNTINGLTVEYFSNDTSDFKNVTDTKWRVAIRDKSGNDIGDIAFEYEESGSFFNGTEDVDGLVVSNISVNIRPEHRGKNYQHLLYSEMFERARATGAIGFSQNIENKGGLPLKSVNKIVGKDGSKIWTLRDYEAVSTTQENFDRLMSNAPKMRSGKGLHSEFVQNNGRLDPNAHYKPREYSDAQLNNEFIGKFASENPEIADKFFIRLKENDGGTLEEWDYKMVIYDKQTKKAVARTKWQMFENDEGIMEDAAADVEILNDAYKGMKLSHLMQSERLERSRFLGAEKVRSQITNEEGIPIKNYAKTIGADKGEITSSFAERFDDDGLTKYIPATMENFKQEMDLSKAHADGTWKPTVYYRANLDPNAWYKPKERTKIGSNASSVGLLFEGVRSGRILRTSSYKGLGLEDSLLIAHTPDTAKIGEVMAGDKALADLQGGIFYAIANGNKIWASNFAGEGDKNILVKYANRAVKNNKDGRTYIMLVKADNSKIFASVDGARGVSSIFKHLNDSGVMSDLKYIKALKESAKTHLKLTNLDGLDKETLFSRIDDALLNSEANKISFERRAKFSRSIATLLKKSGAFDSEASKKALADSFNSGFERGFSKKEMERVFGNLMAEDIIKDVPVGHIYGALDITSTLREAKESNHRGYNASIEQTSGEPAKLIIFDKTAHATEVLNKKSGERILKKDPTRHLKDSEGNYIYETDDAGQPVLTKGGKPKRIVEHKGEGAYNSYVGGQIPYQEVRGKSRMPFKPLEGEQNSIKGRYDIDKAIVEKLKEKFKGYKNLTAKDMLEFIVENQGQFSPLASRMLESLDGHGLGAFVQQQTSTLGSTQKGTKGWTYHNYNHSNNTVNMLLERNVERRRGWTNSFEELMIEEVLHAITIEKIPDAIKHGSTIENTLKNVDHFLRNKKKYEYQWREEWKMEGGATEDWFVIADAYKQVHKYFASGKFPDGTVIDKKAKHYIDYRLTNMGEFVVGITQDSYVQKILSQIKVPKTERSILTKILEAIKKIWNFDDSVVDSLLAHTSDAVGTVIQRKKIGMETVGMGRFPEKSKQYFDGMPKFKPAEGWRDWNSENTSIGSVIKNTVGYMIMNQGNKFKVYNPSKVMVGIYTDLEQAKRRVQRDEPK